MKKLALGTLLSILLAALPTSAQDRPRAASSDGAAHHADGSQRARSFAVPLILAAGGAANSVRFSFDTTIFMTYTPGLAGLGAGPGATVDLYLFDDSAADPLRSAAGQAVCNPCTFTLGPDRREESVRVGRLTTAGGINDVGVRLGLAVLVVGGADPDGVNLQGFVVTSHDGTFHQSVFTFEPQPIAAEQ